MHALVIALVLATAPTLADASGPAKPKPAKGSPDEVVCHREEVTGSLAQVRKTCFTRAQWTAQAEATQRDAVAQDEHSRVNACGATAPGGC